MALSTRLSFLFFMILCVACGGTDSTGPGGGAGGGGGDGATGGVGGSSGGEGGAGGTGGVAGVGGMGGEPREITSSLEWNNSELVYQLENCQCQTGDVLPESACLAEADNLPLSDRQDLCFDEIVINEEQMTLETRLECLVTANLAAADCLADVVDCDPVATMACASMRTMDKQNCPTPFEDVIPMTVECQTTLVDDGVDAFLDSREAQCDCLSSCENADRDQETVDCMVELLEMEVAMLGPQGPIELRCFTEFWRKNAVCFGNEESCEGPTTACSEIPPMVCAIDGAVLDDCLSL